MHQSDHPRATPRATGTTRLAVIADNPLIVSAIRSGFAESGELQLVGYRDAQRATPEMILNASADVVMVDREANDSDAALRFIQGLRARDSDVHVIVLTIDMTGDWLHQALSAGADSVMSKETHPVALATLVLEAVAGHVVHARRSPMPGVTRTSTGASQHSSLTEREAEILQLVAAGATNSDIARRLWVTQQTVKFHVSNVYRKLGVANRTEACRYAHVNGLVARQHSPSLAVAS
jgi:DNA-binding NarL/FixJ family response regulator